MRIAAILLLCTLAAPTWAADDLADGWTPEGLKEASGGCTNALVADAWENTKRDQKLDPKLEMTPEIREQLQPQIDAFAKLCECTVKKMAKTFGRTAYEKDDGTVEKYTRELVEKGKCKLPKP